jgi:hypothetical protein
MHPRIRLPVNPFMDFEEKGKNANISSQTSEEGLPSPYANSP